MHTEKRYREGRSEEHCEHSVSARRIVRAPLSSSACIVYSIEFTTYSMPTRMSPPVTLAKNEHEPSRDSGPRSLVHCPNVPGYSMQPDQCREFRKAEERSERARGHRTMRFDFFFSFSLFPSFLFFFFFLHSTETTWLCRSADKQTRP